MQVFVIDLFVLLGKARNGSVAFLFFVSIKCDKMFKPLCFIMCMLMFIVNVNV